MGEIVYQCGWCRHRRAGRVLHSKFLYHKRDALEGRVRVAALCGRCDRVSELTYLYDLGDADWAQSADDPSSQLYWNSRLGTEDDLPVPAIVAEPEKQHPALTARPPSGIGDATTLRAWSAAERAVADAPIKGMAYRQVLESAVKALEAAAGEPSKPGTPLARRVESLIAVNALPNHLPELIEKARGLGNRAAHEFNDFDHDDVAIIRELCEAVLRQCFTIPHLVKRTEELIEKRRKTSEAREATAKAAGSSDDSDDDIPF
jgi:hypothetical protein